jgi:carbamoyltransferase
MKVLGVHSLTHDLGAALCIDGEITHVVEEERLSRIKHHPGIEVEGTEPRLSIEWVLAESGLSLSEIDLIAHVGWPGEDFMRLDLIRRRFRDFACTLDPSGKKTLFVDHHRAHAASAYYAAGFESALVGAIDGQGDWISTSLYLGHGRELKKIDEYFVDQSLGFMYSRAARLLGLGDFGFGEGKLVALAGYGQEIPDFSPPVILEGDRYRIVDGYYEKTFLPFRRSEGELTQEHKDFAATVQITLERVIIHILSRAAQKYQQKNLVLGGGVALNCRMNGRLAALPWVKKMFVQPGANDCGLCIGAAYLGAVAAGDTPRAMKSVFLGPDLKPSAAAEVFRRNKLRAEEVENPAADAAKIIAKGGVVAWMSGRLEFGPRALGHRSLLGDPRSVEVRDYLNAIKQRESWRPIAPSILADRASYFDPKITSPYMTHAVALNEASKNEIAAAVHVDGSARVQIVLDRWDPFYGVLEAFAGETGVPVVLNTSLNQRGEPLCASIEDGLRFFFTTPTDALIIDRWVLRK